MSISTEVDIRLYNADGTRKTLPQPWISELSYDIGERGGCLTGSLQLSVPWEQLNLTGTEYLDVRLFGNPLPVYRGFLRQTQQELSTPERASPTMTGLMALLNGYQCRRDYTFAAASIDAVFLAVAHDIVTRAGRLGTLVLDTSGVAALGIAVDVFLASNLNFSDAMNALCDLAPNQLIWGCDVDPVSGTHNRLYLHPRPIDPNSVGTGVTVPSGLPSYHATVGGNVTAFVYPLDANQVINRVIVTGGTIVAPNNPNLVNNPSFETMTQPGETTSNLLDNGNFAVNNGVATTFPAIWQLLGSPTLNTNGGHSGSASMDLNTNGQGVYQDIWVAPGVDVYQSCWFELGTSTASTLQLKLEAFNAGGASLGVNTQSFSFSTPTTPPLVWEHCVLAGAWLTPATTVRVRVTYLLTATTGNNNLADCSVWTGEPTCQGWQLGGAVSGLGSADAYVNKLNTAWGVGVAQAGSDGPIPFEPGVAMARIDAVTTAPDGYVELCTHTDVRTSIQAYTTYSVIFRVACSTAGGTGSAYCGVRVWGGTTLQTSVPGPQAPGLSAPAVTAVPVTINNTGVWTLVTFQFTVSATSTSVDLFLRLLNGGVPSEVIYYVDAAQLIQGQWGAPNGQTLYTLDGTYRGMRDVTDYAPGVLSPAAANSIATYGEREAQVSNDNVVDEATMDAFAIGYLQAHATPIAQARLTIEGLTAADIVGCDGLVTLGNLPNAPPPLPVSKISTHIGASIRLDADLNNERPDQAILLRRIQATGLGGVPWP